MQQKEEIHKLTCDGRKSVILEGLIDVAMYDEKEVHARTNKGILCIKGTSLNIDRLDKEAHFLVLTGTIDSMTYKNSLDGGNSFWKRLFR